MEEKTERPTSRKLKKAKERGQIAQSSELSSSLIFAGALLLLWLFGPSLTDSLKCGYTQKFNSLSSPEFIDAIDWVKAVMTPVLFIVGGLFIIALVAHLIQRGWIWSWPPQARRKEGIRWIFIIAKIFIVICLTYFTLIGEKPILEVHMATSAKKVDLLFKKVFFLLVKICLVFVLIGFIDFFYQRFRHYQRMHMTRQEVKDENREDEGDRHTKHKFRKF